MAKTDSNLPTTEELLRNPVLQNALEEAWKDSLPNDVNLRHEEGGWVYFDPTTSRVEVRRAMPGVLAAIDLSGPLTIAGFYVVATFHTHPNPSAEGWEMGPSDQDASSALSLGVPCFIRAEDGIHTTGPDRRRGGLSGNPGFPQ